MSDEFKLAAHEYCRANLQNFNGQRDHHATTILAILERFEKVTTALKKVAPQVTRTEMVDTFGWASIDMMKRGYDPENVRIVAERGINACSGLVKPSPS